MSKKRFYGFAIIGLILALSVAGCAKSGGKTTENLKLDDVILTVNDLEYDFVGSVSFTDDNGVAVEFTCDASAVKLGTPGKYTVIYTVGKKKYERDVFVYGTPSIEVVNTKVEYKDAIEGNFSSYVAASDNFGSGLKIVYESGLTYDQNGALVVGEREFVFATIDALGGTRRETVTLTIKSPTDSFAIGSVTMDYANPQFTVATGDRKVTSVYVDGVKLDDTYYICNNGLLLLTPEFAKTYKTVSGKELYINFNTCSVKTFLTITDSMDTAYEIDGNLNGESFCLYDKIYTPKLTLKTPSVQDAYFNYYIEENGNKTLFESDTFIPEKSGDYKFIAEVMRNGEKRETVVQSFNVSHYSSRLVAVPEIVALGERYDMSVETDLTGITASYDIVDENGVFSVSGKIITPIKEGDAVLKININGGEIIKQINVTSVDYYNLDGKTRDFALSKEFWLADGNSLTVGKVSDLRTTAKTYSFNALGAGRSVSLKAEVALAAKKVGYEYFTFYCFADDSEDINVYASSARSAELLLRVENNGRWAYGSVDLSKVDEGSEILFVSSGKISIAKAEFVGADISAYVSDYISEASDLRTKSEDLVTDNIWGRLIRPVCNLNAAAEYVDTGVDRVTTSDDGDYFVFNRNEEYYLPSYGSAENALIFDADWISAAKKLGYSVIGIWVNDCDGYAFLKRNADGALTDFLNGTKAWHATANDKWGFISLDLSSFETGDSVIITMSGTGIKLSGITFRNSDHAAPNLVVG